jgi:hypothetical protein
MRTWRKMYIKLNADPEIHTETIDMLYPEREESREAIRKFEEHFEYALENYFAPQK